MLRQIARPMLGSWFVYDGYDALRHPSEHVEIARAPINKAVGLAGGEPLDDKTIKRIVQAQGAVTIVLGTAVAFSKTPRTAGLLLAVSTAPHAILAAPTKKDDVARSARMRPFLAKVAAVGSALLIAADTDGKPSMGWRIQKARTERALTQSAKSSPKPPKSA